MSNEDQKPILTHRRGDALWITINREDRRNAINPEVIAGIHAAVTSAADDESLRAIVLTGAGEKAFCAGADLTRGSGVFAAAPDEPTTDFGRLARAMRGISIPVIARINGACVAGGMGLMALCDLAIAADHARFGLPEVMVGVFPMQVLVYLRQMVSPRHLNLLCLTGELINAAKAQEIGIANEVVPYAELDARVDALVGLLSRGSPVALRWGKRAIAAMESMSFEGALAYAETQIALLSRTESAKEGLAAFTEKRTPSWTTKK
ncbi:MAG: enoyl-CoA hydratase-related protein [Candidatus Korobacteraceae bacterium]|jgi:enoyl-CoA hydratase/carnithine racemase